MKTRTKKEIFLKSISDLIGKKEVDKMTAEKVLENLRKNLIGFENWDMNDVVYSFEDFEEYGKNEVLFERANNSGYDYIAYIDAKDSTQFLIKTDKNDVVIDVWIA